MPDVLPGYTYDRASQRYRNGSTGRFVARNTVVDLLDSSVSSAERRLGALTTAYHEGSIDASVWMEQMRSELRRLHLQNAALGAGGWDSLTFSDYGRIGYKLRDDYQRLNRFAHDIRDGNSTIAQSLARTNMYIGRARTNYWEVERERAQVSAPGMHLIERRVLTPAEHCKSCLDYYSWGWQLMGVLPIPGDGSTECLTNDKCILVRREVSFDELGDWITVTRGGEPGKSNIAEESALSLYHPPTETIQQVNAKVDRQVNALAERERVTPREIEERITKSLADLIAGKNVSIRFDSLNVDFLITDKLFKSQFETLTSGGDVNLEFRSTAEQRGMGIPVDVLARSRPVYGIIDVDQNYDYFTRQYGDLEFILRDTVKPRTTITVGDSLENFYDQSAAGTPITATSRESWGGYVEELYNYSRTGRTSDLLDKIQYIEAQIQGGVQLSEVSRVIDRYGRLTTEQVEKLNGLGIEVWKSK